MTPACHKVAKTLALSTQGDRIEAANDRVRFAVNLTTGAALSYEIDGTELFADGFGVRPNFWRAPVDNDYGDGMPRRTQVWKEASRDADAEVTGRMEGDAAVIAATRALAEILQEEADLPQAQRQSFIDIIVQETGRLTRLVNQVLDMAKIDSGHVDWQLDTIDMHALWQGAAATTAGSANEPRITRTRSVTGTARL